ncbi:MAG: 4Fe-4S dicluster domain-containing protein [Sulfurospirillum sp.]|nr:4Fe-4S dicluster domain-containing protein [Sulfurospirillum sp.]
MLKEYLYCNHLKLEFPLDTSIDIVSSCDDIRDEYIISNIKTPQAQKYAPEINFYIQNSCDSLAVKITNVKKLYDARACGYDLAQDIDFSQDVGKRIMLVSCEDLKNTQQTLQEKGFSVVCIDPSNIVDVNGHIGELTVILKQNDAELEVQTDQILWYDAPDFAMKQSGTVDPNRVGLESALEQIIQNDGTYNYKNFVKYDAKICQYHERREEICGKCAEVCPTIAILKIDAQKHLEFSHIDCHGCGGCVSVCPSGALDYSQMPRVAFKEVSNFYVDTIALIIPVKMQLESLHVELPAGVLPLGIEGEKFLHEAHLMSLLQTSGNPVIFYSDFISKGTGDTISIINEIFKRKYNKQAIFTCKNAQELQEAFAKIQPLDECKYGFDEERMNKREIFSARLAHLVGNDDLGVITTGEHVHYGMVHIDQDKCTLCLSCVGACNVRALTAHPEDNSLRFNPSICTTCGYCEVTCPEKDCLHVTKDELHLEPSYFVQNVMARDKLFACVRCGKEFATTKSVQKIANMMTPLFGNDAIKIKTLYCCADCKPKVMLEAYVEGR